MNAPRLQDSAVAVDPTSVREFLLSKNGGRPLIPQQCVARPLRSRGFVVHNLSRPTQHSHEGELMKISLTIVLMTWCLTATAEQPDTYTWSSTACAKCQSTIVYQAWFPDKSPLVAEGMPGMHAGALVALSLVKDTMVVSLGVSIAHDPPLTLNPTQSVTIETDSSPNMVLYALQAPGPGFHKDDVAVLRQLNSRSLPLRPHVPASGFLFFPFDHKATRFVVVVKVGGQTFRFPFAQDPRAQANLATRPCWAQGRRRKRRRAARAVAGVLQKRFFCGVGRRKACGPGAGVCREVAGEERGTIPRRVFFTNPRSPHRQLPGGLRAVRGGVRWFSPSLRASPVRDATGLGGEGSGNDSQRAVWTYHYAGTAASTTTTTTFIERPFGDKTRTLYAFTWDQMGERSHGGNGRSLPGAVTSRLSTSVKPLRGHRRQSSERAAVGRCGT